jgi:O-antigen/teichoic acid export membrane protein
VSPPASPRRRSVDAGLIFAGHVVGLGLAFLSGLVSARVLAPALRGEYAMLTTLAQTITVLAGFGFGEAVVYFYRRGDADTRRTATSILVMNAVAALSLLGVALWFGPWLAEQYFPTGGIVAAWIAVGAGLLGVVQRNGTAFLQARERFLQSSGIGLLQPAFFLAVLAAVAWVGWSFDTLVAMFLVTFALPALLVLAPLLPQTGARAVDAPYIGRVMRFSVKSYANVALGQLNYRIGLFVIGALIPDLARLADYHIASTLAGLLWILPDAYSTAIYPRLAGLATERERSAETVSAVRIVVVPVVVMAVALAVAAPPLVPLLFGEDYAGAVPLTLLLLPGAVAMSVSKVLSRYFLSCNRQQMAALGMAVGVAVDVAALFVLTPRWGIVAAPVAATAAYLASLAVGAGAFLMGAELRREDARSFPARELRAYTRVARELFGRLSRRVSGRPIQ